MAFKSAPDVRFSRISFGLDVEFYRGIGENYLGRMEGGNWGWYCEKGHCVEGETGGGDFTVREFCARLYRECGVCRGVEG